MCEAINKRYLGEIFSVESSRLLYRFSEEFTKGLFRVWTKFVVENTAEILLNNVQPQKRLTTRYLTRSMSFFIVQCRSTTSNNNKTLRVNSLVFYERRDLNNKNISGMLGKIIENQLGSYERKPRIVKVEQVERCCCDG